MDDKRFITVEDAKTVGMQLGVDWSKIDLDQFRRGLHVELQPGSPDAEITMDDLVSTGKITLSRLQEIRDYYTWLDQFDSGLRG
jgi:Protein of unknown function (DUF5661)